MPLSTLDSVASLVVIDMQKGIVALCRLSPGIGSAIAFRSESSPRPFKHQRCRCNIWRKAPKSSLTISSNPCGWSTSLT